MAPRSDYPEHSRPSFLLIRARQVPAQSPDPLLFCTRDALSSGVVKMQIRMIWFLMESAPVEKTA